MLTAELKKKKQFVKELGDVIVKYQPNVIDVEYEVYENIYGNGFQEFLVITYHGGAKSVRNCNANSFSAIFKEIATKLNTGYYDELDFYKDVQESPNMVLVND